MGASTRPTQAKLRQALLNSIQADIVQARVLDLFSGSGALGFEALSRGASEVVFVESDIGVCSIIHANARALGVESQIKVVAQSLMGVTDQLSVMGRFEVIFADPPYNRGWEAKLLEQLPFESILSPDGVFCLEWGVQKSNPLELPSQVSGLQQGRQKNYGDSRLTHYRWASGAEV